MKKENNRFYNWCFTSYKENAPSTETKHLTYICYQREICPTTGKLHFQGYMEFKEKMTLFGIKKILKDNEIHLEERKGSQEQAIEYCNKKNTAVPNSWFEWGRKKRPGHDKHLDEIAEDIKEGFTQRELFMKYDGKYIRHSAQIRRTLQVFHGLDDLDEVILERRNNKTPNKNKINKVTNKDYLFENADIPKLL